MNSLIPIRLSSRILSGFTSSNQYISCLSTYNFSTFNRLQTNPYLKSSVFSVNYKNSYRPYGDSNKIDTKQNLTPKVESVIQDSTVSKVSQRTRLKQAVRDYGATIIVFHVAISLTSLGLCYVAISNGVDAVRLLTYLGFSETLISSKVAVGGSTFVMSYAVHKLFAPIRIGITLSVAPFIVRYLRKINWLKPPKSKT
ncbi:protein FAM210B, mitochondrial [Caerostris extrusa]|uniref:Protein FAM210B, mitochondrial n=1 Tax=Caerostris extrusa TaxID=172846 RepID=A0AAV4MKF9_CAEEX|nr:protein FAM210B, mitochondrial [Caerostris extrusa]